MLIRAEEALSIVFAFSNLFEIKAKGIEIIELISIIPIIEPIPKIKMYSNPSQIEFIVVNTSKERAALPAKPCNSPIYNDL